MGKLHSIGNLQFRIYAGDHRPAHIHIHHPDYEVQMDIVSLAVLRGTLPPRDRRIVLDWIRAHQREIIGMWNDLNPELAV